MMAYCQLNRSECFPTMRGGECMPLINHLQLPVPTDGIAPSFVDIQ
ncbi:hypothetical protein ALP78_200020 [Pseudomonas coronafaciens pv. striafaciens]|uniref:Uncharacterized protein n=1 Tax=Pseudomonas coronafaciens pv. striafaciens TaxID=235276 RepID=A0A3M4XVY5_9PSED|nr:hypothetical protein ALP78_200020 [Pseudomonas coronafaciens pv. striafaciens]